MWRDRCFTIGLIGTVLACLACLTPFAVVTRGAIGLGAWAGRLDAVPLPAVIVFLALAIYRYRVSCRRTP